MRIIFGREKLERLNPKEIIEFYEYANKDYYLDNGNAFEIISVSIKDTDLLNTETTIILHDIPLQRKYKYKCKHSICWSCANFTLEKI